MKIREFLNKANRLVTYTREQILSWDDETLDRKARQIMGTKDSIPATCKSDSWWLQEEAIEHDPERYVKELADVTEANWHWDGCEGNMSPEGIAWLLQATPRQRTIAAILTLQGQGGTEE